VKVKVNFEVMMRIGLGKNISVFIAAYWNSYRWVGK
jgi:hypothetical protein